MLESVEFKAKIKQGVIEIPKEYQQQLSEEVEVKVIVIQPDKQISQTGIIAELTENPLVVRGIRQLTRDDFYQL
jgi:hypothetical protein